MTRPATKTIRRLLTRIGAREVQPRAALTVSWQQQFANFYRLDAGILGHADAHLVTVRALRDPQQLRGK